MCLCTPPSAFCTAWFSAIMCLMTAGLEPMSMKKEKTSGSSSGPLGYCSGHSRHVPSIQRTNWRAESTSERMTRDSSLLTSPTGGCSHTSMFWSDSVTRKSGACLEASSSWNASSALTTIELMAEKMMRSQWQ